MSLVSIIIPVYNRREHLVKAAESVFVQSVADWELIIADDGSTDATLSAALGLRGKDPERVKVLELPHSGMPGAVRNRGAEAACGRYLAFLDSDDLWLPGKLEAQLSRMAECGCRLSHTRELWMRSGREVSQKGQKHRREGYIFQDCLKKCIIGPSTVMMERGLFFQTGGFHENIEIAEDYEYWLRICSTIPVSYVNEAYTVKQAGDWPQLSEKYGRIEWFRLAALAGLLGLDLPDAPEPCYLPGYSWPGFDPEAESAAREELRFKCGVWASGCRKRGRYDEADAMDVFIGSI